ncbi:hypothetical protein ACFPH6_40285, partial [Streptomyces xiangluensis]
MSIPYDPEPQSSRPALEPTNVQRRRTPGALSELVRLVDAVERERRNKEHQAVAAPAAETTPPPSAAEATPPPLKAEATPPAWAPGANALPWTTDDETQELPPVTGEERSGPPERRAAYGRTPWMRRAALAVAAVAIALAGFAAALLLTWDRGTAESQA